MASGFEGMTHEDMLRWLDQANSAAVRGAADRLKSAAEEIHKIAEELKVRPQVVEWKGAGNDAFRTWTANLANETLRLGDYSAGAAQWLTQASYAITHAKATIPRTIHKGAEANLEAALGAKNDPDAAAVVKKAETRVAANESARYEAAQRMRALSEAYNQSTMEMDRLERPKFPPPPETIVPEGASERADVNGYVSGGRPTGGPAGVVPGAGSDASVPGGSHAATAGVATPLSTPTGGVAPAVGVVQPPVAMEIDSVSTPLPVQSDPVAGPALNPGPSKFDGSLTAPAVPPVIQGGSVPQLPRNTGSGATGMTRPPTALGAGPIGRPAGDGGITGGRPVAQTPGRPAGGLPRGTVIGGEGAHAGRGTMGQGSGTGGAGGRSRSGIVGGRRLTGESGGVVGGRPQQGTAMGRPFTPGGTGLVRDGGTGDGGRGTGQVGRGASTTQRTGGFRRDESERPDYLVEDEDTWQQGGRRVVPPVID